MENKFEGKTAVIIVTFNALEKTKETLSILAWARKEPNIRIFLADNNSQEDLIGYVRKNFSWIYSYQIGNNLGFAGGMNFALEKIREEKFDFEYLMIVNPDLKIDRESTMRLVESLKDSGEQVGIIGPKVISNEGIPENTVLKDIGLLGFMYKVIIQQINKTTTSPGFVHPLPKVITEVDGLSGACLLFKKKLIDELGFFDNDYFMYQEDRDFCIKARKAGWKILFNPEVEVKHYRGSSSETRTNSYLWLKEQTYVSMLIFFRKNKGKFQAHILKYFWIALLWVRVIRNNDKEWAGNLLARVKNPKI